MMLRLQFNNRVALSSCNRPAIAYCESIGDYASRELLEEILCSEEDHIDWLETQLSLIDAVGLQNYLQSQMDE
jgi:bacterioferritin